MLFRDLSAEESSTVEPAYQAFLKTQRSLHARYGLLFQSEHSRLAGSLAGALLPGVFGELNADVIAAIAHHDYGWDTSDQKQFDHLSENDPLSFTAVSASETLPSWISSIAHGRELGPLPAVLISRHCCLLGTGSEAHAGFVAAETIRRLEIERTLVCSAEQLRCWTAALGFCDLLSLYLCSGSKSPVTLPLCHPQAKDEARTVTLRWIDDGPHLSEPIFKSDICFFANGLEYGGDHASPRPLSVHWVFD